MITKKEYDKLVTLIWSGQRSHSKDRGHCMPSYTKEWLRQWMKDNGVLVMMCHWKDNNCIKELKPSVDRLDDSEGYTESNIQLVTWKENRDKEYNRRVTGSGNKRNSPIKQMAGSRVIKIWESTAIASRELGIHRPSITRAISESRQAGGYTWQKHTI